MKNFKLILRSLVSNDACIQGGRTRPWYLVIPMFLIAMILALVPIFVQTITKQGDSIVSSNAYQMDVSSQRFVEALNDNGITMEIKNHKLLVNGKVSKTEWEAAFTTKDESENNCYIHEHPDATNPEDANKAIRDLGVYYVPKAELTDEKYNTIVTFPVKDEEGNVTKVNRNYSLILFTEENVIIYVYASSKTSNNSIGTIYGDYQSFEDGFKINDIKNWEDWKSFYRVAYNNNRLKLTWQTTLIMLGINAGITVFMGFMLWVLTRGRNNLNWFGLWETQKIAFWCTLSPAILTAGLGFLIASFSQVMFPMLMGVRVMWLSMKWLRPENAQMYPPLKEKVVDVKPLNK